MTFKNTNININIPAGYQAVFSQPLMVPDGASKITVQFFHTLSGPEQKAAEIRLLQSTDGIHFDPLNDANNSQLTVSIFSDSKSATLNILGLLTLWIQFQFNFYEDVTGSIDNCNVLFA